MPASCESRGDSAAAPETRGGGSSASDGRTEEGSTAAVAPHARDAAGGTLLLVAFASLCSVLAPLNSTMIAVALPAIRDEFGVSSGTVSWLISAYLIAMAVAQPVAGRLGDQIGRGRVVAVGLLLFSVTSVGAGLSQTFEMLTAFRIAQAVFGAALIPNALALLRERASPNELGRLTGYNGAAIAAAAGLGPLLGAAALELGSWRFVFPLSIPVAAGALLLLPRLGLGYARRGEAAVNWAGAVQYAVVLTAVTALLGASRERVSLRLVIGWLAFAAGLAVFVRAQRRSPVAAWGLFRIRSFAAASVLVLLTNLAMYTTLLMVPFVVTDLLHAGSALSGLLLGTMALSMGLAAPLAGLLTDSQGRRLTAQLGSGLVLAAALLLTAALGMGVTPGVLAGLLAMLGAGVGASTAAANTAAIESAPREAAGAAAGTSSMMRYLGSIIGIGVLAAMLGSGIGVTPDASAFVAIQVIITMIAAGAVVAASFVHVFPDRLPA